MNAMRACVTVYDRITGRYKEEFVMDSVDFYNGFLPWCFERGYTVEPWSFQFLTVLTNSEMYAIDIEKRR